MLRASSAFSEVRREVARVKNDVSTFAKSVNDVGKDQKAAFSRLEQLLIQSQSCASNSRAGTGGMAAGAAEHVDVSKKRGC
eukprot:5684119-Karenia_brevis.AAC.2